MIPTPPISSELPVGFISRRWSSEALSFDRYAWARFLLGPSFDMIWRSTKSLQCFFLAEFCKFPSSYRCCLGHVAGEAQQQQISPARQVRDSETPFQTVGLPAEKDDRGKSCFCAEDWEHERLGLISHGFVGVSTRSIGRSSFSHSKNGEWNGNLGAIPFFSDRPRGVQLWIVHSL